jgi:hypothetical protein
VTVAVPKKRRKRRAKSIVRVDMTKPDVGGRSAPAVNDPATAVVDFSRDMLGLIMESRQAGLLIMAIEALLEQKK